MEPIPKYDNHPVLKPGVTVQIGLGKNTRLESVFERYVKVCKNKDPSHRPVSVCDLEFVHSMVLKASDTVEQAALMKDDRIRVRAERSVKTQQEREHIKIQRDSDLLYFQQMKDLSKVDPSMTNDLVYLDCRGRLPIGGPKRSRPIPCVVSLVSKRCPWLRRKIEFALGDQKPSPSEHKLYYRAGSFSRDTPSSRNTSPRGGDVSEDHDGSNLSISREEDEEDLSIQMVDRNNDDGQMPVPPAAALADIPAAAEIEMEDDQFAEEEVMDDVPSNPTVVILDHPPQAMELLLEYCYTNRVPSLGMEAFKVAARSKLLPRDLQGNIPPHSMSSGGKRWPNRGEPTVNFHTAVACLELAEEAGMPRLSLMCEVAASQLVQTSNFTEALSICGRIKNETGSDLRRLRQAAMDIVLHAKHRITDKSNFRYALMEESALLVPTLLQGLVQSMDERMDRRQLKDYENRDWQVSAFAYFDQCDREDDYKRARERRQRRIERHPEGDQSVVVDEFEAMATRRSLKRVRHSGHSIRSVLRRTEKRDRRNSR
jgi:hypothetical protein